MQPKTIVDSIIATFAVFTGFTLNGRLAKFPLAGFDDKNLWLFVILATLLLRFIIGSAVHLNRTYVDHVPGKNRPPSRSAGLLFKDLVFLVVFGIVAVKVKEANAVGVLHWAAWFLVVAFTWVIVDYPLRAACARRWKDDHEYAPLDVSLSWAGRRPGGCDFDRYRQLGEAAPSAHRCRSCRRLHILSVAGFSCTFLQAAVGSLIKFCRAEAQIGSRWRR